MNADGYTVAIVRDPEVLQTLQPDWDRVFQRADRPYLSQSFEWAWCVWEAITQPGGGKLCCIVVRDRSRPVLFWPLAIHGYHRFWRAARPLSMGGDYTDVLVEASPQAKPLAALAWRALQKGPGIDLILAERVRTDSLLHRVLVTPKAAATDADLAFYVAWEDYADWDAYQRRLAGRQTMDRQLRRLHEAGHVAFELVEDPPRQQQLVAWLLQRKLEQLAQRGTAPVWGDDPKPLEGFLIRASRRVRRFGQLQVFALTLDHEPLAVLVTGLDASRLIALYVAYAPRWAKYSPGNLVFRHALHWAFERGLLVDFCWGNQGYKQAVYCNRQVEVLTRLYATNGWGRVSLQARAWQRRLKARRSARQERVPPDPVSAT